MRRLAALVLALVALAPAAAVSAASPALLTPGNTITVNANACVGPTSQRNSFSITATVAAPSDANKIVIASHVTSRENGTLSVVHSFPLAAVNLNGHTDSLSIARTWRGTPAQHTRIIATVRFLHGSNVVAAARRISVAC